MSERDVLLIGTGPPMLFEGLARAVRGQKVMFVDQASQIGGSWHCPEVMGCKGVEAGVHLIENRPHLNALFEALLEPKERIIDGPDFGLWRGHRMRMENARIFLYGGIAGRNLLKGRFERVAHSLRNMSEAVRHRNLPFLYPKTGMGRVLESLERCLKNLGAVFHFDRPIQSIRMTDTGVEAVCASGTLNANHLIMSSRAHAPIAGLERLWEDVGADTVTSVVLRVEGPAPLFDGYVEVINDRFLKRARNVTCFAHPQPERDVALVTIQLRGSAIEVSPDHIKAHMTEIGLLDARSKIVETHVDEVRLNTLPNRALTQIEAAHPDKITVLRTVDLGDGRYEAETPKFTP